ncbi:CPXCG motif-containing cysteine-rich protein [Planctobacterium marinum]|uniref:CPXCG motif-containing cysteine-rich protein n=1 Tax=Planctobacterium marinum TaxID=1631968 RepID=A0AA48KQ42_9ALTE|nr:hypothetical protein MACH26_28720 [Planctobacterium marinum]
MSLSHAESFHCPYCMTVNDIEIDVLNDIDQVQLVDCQICCQPIEVWVQDSQHGLLIEVKQEVE